MSEALSTAIAEINREISLEEAVAIGADDPAFYGQFFFPGTCRQESPDFHLGMWDKLLGSRRHVSFMVFRGGAKTSMLRLFVSYCIAYGISRTILFVGKSQDHSRKSVEWLMGQVNRNKKWAAAFGLNQGKKWTGEECSIWNETEQVYITVMAYGITGSIRGVNVEDYRPDLIVVDDPCDEENTATPEARKKTSDLFFGALDKSLAPRSEAALAKMVLLQTVLNEGDLISQTIDDPQWDSVVYGCFDSTGHSRWPARWTTDELRADKAAHIARNQLSLWLREMECLLVDDETAAFPSNWLQYWETVPEGGITWIAVDPTPPPKDRDAKKNDALDDAVIMALRYVHGKIYICEIYYTKSPDPDEFIEKIFEFVLHWHAREICIETVLFARTTATILEKAQAKKRIWLIIHKIEDKRNKVVRIRQEISTRASNRQIYVNKSEVLFIEHWTRYPSINHDDDLDALAIGLMKLSPWMEQGDDYIEGDYTVLDGEDEPQSLAWRGAP